MTIEDGALLPANENNGVTKSEELEARVEALQSEYPNTPLPIIQEVTLLRQQVVELSQIHDMSTQRGALAMYLVKLNKDNRDLKAELMRQTQIKKENGKEELPPNSIGDDTPAPSKPTTLEGETQSDLDGVFIEEILAEIQHQRKRGDVLENENLSLRESLKVGDALVGHMRQRLEDWESKAPELEAAVQRAAELEVRHALLQEDRDRLVASQERLAAELSSRIEELQGERENFEKQQKAIAAKSAHLEGARGWEAERTRMQQLILHLDDQLNTSTSQSREATALIGQLQTINAGLRTEVEKLRMSEARMSSEKDVMESTLASLAIRLDTAIMEREHAREITRKAIDRRAPLFSMDNCTQTIGLGEDVSVSSVASRQTGAVAPPVVPPLILPAQEIDGIHLLSSMPGLASITPPATARLPNANDDTPRRNSLGSVSWPRWALRSKSSNQQNVENQQRERGAANDENQKPQISHTPQTPELQGRQSTSARTPANTVSGVQVESAPGAQPGVPTLQQILQTAVARSPQPTPTRNPPIPVRPRSSTGVHSNPYQSPNPNVPQPISFGITTGNPQLPTSPRAQHVGICLAIPRLPLPSLGRQA